MNAVIYVRVSTDEQAQSGTSIATQEADCRAWCDRNGYTVSCVFTDAGRSAKTADRPQFLALVDWCQRHKPAAVIVWKFDRWARNSTDHAVYEAALTRNDVRLISATEPADDNPSGRMLKTILSAVAQFDNEVKAERARHAMRSVAMRGGWITVAPFGFRSARSGTLPILVPHPDKAQVAAELFHGIANGRRNMIQTIAYAREHRLSKNATRALLRKPVYAGFLREKLTDMREVEAAFPGLIPRDVWQTVQDTLDGKRRTLGKRLKHREEFPLRSLMICNVCGQTVSAAWSRGHGGRYGYYYCRHGHVRVRDELVHRTWIELLANNKAEFLPVLEQIRQEARVVITERYHAAGVAMRKAAAIVPRIIEQRARLLDAYLAGDIAQDVFRSRDTELAARQASAAEADQAVKTWVVDVETCVAKTVRLFEDPVALWNRMPVGDRQRFCSALYNGELVLTPSGVAEPGSWAGIIGILREVNAMQTDMARLAGALQNLKTALAPILDLAA